MIVLNRIILAGLLLSGLAVSLLPLAKTFVSEEWRFVFAYGAATGWFFAAAATIAFLVAAVLFLMGHLNGFWKSLYPINFGLALLGFTLIMFTESISIPWALAALVIAIAISFALHRIKFIRQKWGLLLLIAPVVLVEVAFWPTLVVGVVFIGLALLTRHQDFTPA